MGELLPSLENRSLLELSLPGTHDTMTYDLSTTTADNTNDLPASVAWLMHELAPELGAAGVGGLFRDMAQTQALSMKSQLETGIRFFDFRITFSAPPDKGSLAKKDWYCLHSVESNNNAMSYLRQIKSFLDLHPKEIVVVWFSRHGNTCSTGTDQYPGTTPKDRQAFWSQIQSLFGDLVFDKAGTQGTLNQTTVGQMVKQNQRMVFYTSDYSQFTNNDTKAYDACSYLNNTLHGGDLTDLPGTMAMWQRLFESAPATQMQHVANDQMHLVSLAGAPPEFNVKDSVILRYDGGVGRKATAKSCASSFKIPNMTSWCPPTLIDTDQLRAYYIQVAMEMVVANATASGVDIGFPGAIYMDGVDTGGTIRTGVLPLSRSIGRGNYPAGNTGYGMVDTMLLHNVQKACQEVHDTAQRAVCDSLKQKLHQRKLQNPLKRWDDPEHGRLATWPI